MHDGRQDDGMIPGIGPQTRPDKDEARQDSEGQSAPEPRPGLFRGDTREELPAVLPQQHSDAVGADVRGPDDDEEGKHRHAVERPVLVEDDEV